MAMPKIKIGRYETTGGTAAAPPVGAEWAGWIEPEDKIWILFIRQDGRPSFFSKRDKDGGVVGAPALTWDQAREKIEKAQRSFSPHAYEAFMASTVAPNDGA